MPTTRWSPGLWAQLGRGHQGPTVQMGNQGGNTREPVPGCRASEQWFILRQSQLPGCGAPRDRILLTSLWGARGGSIPQRHLEKWCYLPSPIPGVTLHAPVPSVAHHPCHLQAPLPVLPHFPVQPEHITCLFPFQEAQLHPEAFQPIRDGAHTLGKCQHRAGRA